MERRTFIGALATGTFASVAGVVRAQQAGARQVGVLTAGTLGNITGVSSIAPELAGKRLELVREFLPKATPVGELVDPANTYWQRVPPDYERAFRAQRMSPLFVEVAEPAEIEKAIARIAGQRVDALIVRADPIFTSNREQIGRLALQYTLPTMAADQRFVEAGMLMSYAPNQSAVDRIIVSYVDRALQCIRAGVFSIAQASHYWMGVNKEWRPSRKNLHAHRSEF